MLLYLCFASRYVYVSFFFFKQKTAYEMRISDWSSDVCSSDLGRSQFCRVDAVIHVLGCRGLLLGPLLLSPLTIDLRSFIRFGNQVFSSTLHPGVQVRVVTHGMLSVHDGLAISIDRKSTRLNSSH